MGIAFRRCDVCGFLLEEITLKFYRECGMFVCPDCRPSVDKAEAINTYVKFVPNVYLANCSELHLKGDTILVTTQYGKENECVVFNLIVKKEDRFYYSVTRADGFNFQEWVKRKEERRMGWAASSEKKSTEYYNKSNKDAAFLSLMEPIKIGHHSEKRHRRVIEDAHNNMRKSIEASDKADDHKSKAEYWAARANEINLSMPESVEYYEFEYEKAKEYHEGLKSGKYERRHSFSLTYAKKEVNELGKKYELSKRLWA